MTFLKRFRSRKSQEHFLPSLLSAMGIKTTQNEMEALRKELLTDSLLEAQWRLNIPRLRQISPHKPQTTWTDRVAMARAGLDIFYVLTRITRPSVVVETGVASGSMTSFLLAALHRNQHGTLYSFDLPSVAGIHSMDWTADPSEIGFMIPDAYKDRWSLTIEDATYALPRIFCGRTIDYFFHDSEHSYAHMMFEYAFAAKHLSSTGVIVSDDITMSAAFWMFFSDWSTFTHSANRNIGIATRKGY